MDISKKLLTLLAIFCVIASAGVACAADVGTDDVYAVDDFDDVYDVADEFDDGWAGSQYQDDGGWAGSQYNVSQENGHEGAPYIDPDYAHHEPAAGEPANATGNGTATAAQNTTANATSTHTMLATGNPILLLLGVTTLLGGYTVLRKK